jgi:hypothetical protein
MPMNSTSQNPGQKFPLGSGPNAMNNRTLYTTLAASSGVGFVFILLLYASLSGRNPVPSRLPYGIFMSVLPALATFVVLKLTNLFVSWWGAVIVYLALFVLVVIIQAYAR